MGSPEPYTLADEVGNKQGKLKTCPHEEPVLLGHRSATGGLVDVANVRLRGYALLCRAASRTGTTGSVPATFRSLIT